MTASGSDEALRAVVEAFNQRDLGALEALLAPHAEIRPTRAALEGTVYRGHDAASQWFSAVDSTWEELRVEVDDVRTHGDVALGIGRIRGRGRESGVAIDVEAAGIARLGDGLVTHISVYTDRAKAFEAFDRS